MSRLISALNVMVEHPKEITAVASSEKEYYFLYKGKYVWSLREDAAEGYWLYFYPNEKSPKRLAEISADDPEAWAAIEFVTYKGSDFKSREARETFSSLLLLLKEKASGMEAVFDDILGNDIDEVPF